MRCSSWKRLENPSGGDAGQDYIYSDVMERLDIYHNDYVYRSLEDRENDNETIAKDDWDLTAKRYIESKTINKILDKVSATEYDELKDYVPNFDICETISILDKEEQFCKIICQKYIDTMSKEMLLEKDDKILHIFIEDKYIKLKENGKITLDNYQNYLDGDFEVHEYCFYKDLFDGTIKDEIAYDLNDLELFNKDGKWDFYITFDELKELGYGFMVKDNYPLIEKYAVPEEKIFDFFDNFSLEQLDDFEHSLELYFVDHDIIYNQESNTLESRENYTFNSDIIRLACSLITYDDFINDYIEYNPTIYDKSLSKVINYFRENQIKNLMDYGNDSDEGLHKLSSMYKEIMDKLNINYCYVNTRDKDNCEGIFITTVLLENDNEIEVETDAWSGIKVVTENVKSIYENFKNLSFQAIKNQNQTELEFEY